MPLTVEISSFEVAIAGIVRSVFKTMLHFDVRSSPAPYRVPPNVVTSAVFLAGAWKGAIILECSGDQCRRFAHRLMCIPEPPAMDNDVRDAMGELVNMIAGNLKSVLQPGVSLSSPSVLEGPDYMYRICGSNRIARFSFDGEAGPFRVTLVQRNQSAN